jgi:hypothetical protein
MAQRAKEASSESVNDFRCAIFICATPQGLDNSGEGRLLSFEADNEVIKVPTAHIIGSKDPDFQSGVELSRICDHRTRQSLVGLTLFQEWHLLFQRSSIDQCFHKIFVDLDCLRSISEHFKSLTPFLSIVLHSLGLHNS